MKQGVSLEIEYDRDAPSFLAAFVPYAMLNLADMSLTKISLDVAGAVEANPIMAAFLDDSFWSAIAFKAVAVCVVGLVAYKLWYLGYVRKIISMATWLMAGVIVYQMIGILTTT